MVIPPRPQTRADVRLRILDAVLSRLGPSIGEMTLDQIRGERAQTTVDSPATNLLYGAPAQTVAVTDVAVRHDDWEQPVRVYRPTGATTLPVVVWYHGGGWVLGNVTRARWLCSHVAEQVGAVVFAVGYRLAPEHRFPAAIDDAWDGVRWVADHAADHGGDATRIAVMGSSAGGNLAAVVSQRARDVGGPAITQQTLLYPATDASAWRKPVEPGSMTALSDAPMLTRADMAAYFAHYTGGTVDATDPRLSPLHAASLADLPPALVITASHDPLRDEAWRYADRLRAEGTAVRITDYAGMTHGFTSFPGIVGAARQALAEIVQTQREAFATAST